MIKSEQIVHLAHFLEKFRKAIITMFIIVIIATSFMYFKSDYIISILTKPLGGIKLYFMTPVEGIMAKMKVAFLGGVVLSSPILAYIVISVCGSKITKEARRLLYFIIIPFAVLLFIGGIIFGYKLLLPSTINFLLECGNDFMKANLSGSDYFSFVDTLLLTIGLLFQLPLILIALSSINIVNSKMLMGKRKFAIMISFITVAFICPSLDAFTFILITLPIIALYEISIWCIYVLEKNKKASS
ncbi:Sec-independent protein translocase protein TatC [Clostridium polyendosporum]|uniref:Sec-independent protein translocase protein TatC n=1 Tax=Clostridium polyendosporum TaxID=69208 RepID=A0A919RYG8_9CLOT|nr:twin-arginine translocase subunit TatC [Clostridium polyendosporum]GIM28084.1 Sec-independent protein translocase protein TatC [Clostridium polyendosporum]